MTVDELKSENEKLYALLGSVARESRRMCEIYNQWYASDRADGEESCVAYELFCGARQTLRTTSLAYDEGGQRSDDA